VKQPEVLEFFLVFAGTNAVDVCVFAGDGGRSFEENQRFFEDAREEGSWKVGRVKGRGYRRMPYQGEADAERVPLLRRIED
jgi:hypothetical protein